MRKVFIVYLICLLNYISASSQNANAINTDSVRSDESTYTELSEIEIIASKISRTSDGYRINLKNSNITKGKNALQTLNYLPSVNVLNNNIEINGLPITSIFIDDHEIVDRNELSQLRGEMIDKIYVKYVSSDNAVSAVNGGDIYITLKQPPRRGAIGSVSGQCTIFRRQYFGNESVSAAVKGRFERFSFYDYFALGGLQFVENTDQKNFDKDNNEVAILNSEHIKDFYIQNRFSLSYDFSSRSKIQGSYYIGYQNNNPFSDTDENNITKQLYSHFRTIAQEGTIRYTFDFNDKSRLSAIVDYYHYSPTRHQNEHQSGSIYRENMVNGYTDLWKGDLAYTWRMKNWLSWQFGATIKAVYVKEHTEDYSFFDNGYNLQRIKIAGLTPLVFLTASGEVWKVKYRVGINWMLNKTIYTDKIFSTQDRHYARQFDPSASVTLPFGPNNSHSISVSYKHFLDDIPYSALSSVVRWIDAYNYSIGNSQIRSSTGDNVTLNISLCNGKINLSGAYAKSHNSLAWETCRDPNNEKVYYTHPININEPGKAVFTAQYVSTFFNIWTLQLYGRLGLSKENSLISGNLYDNTRARTFFQWNNSLTFTKGWGASVSANLEPKYKVYNRTFHTVYNIDVQIYKNLLNDRLQISLNSRLIDKRRRMDTRVSDTLIKWKATTPQHSLGLTVTWSFSAGRPVSTNVIGGQQEYQEIRDIR